MDFTDPIVITGFVAFINAIMVLTGMIGTWLLFNYQTPQIDDQREIQGDPENGKPSNVGYGLVRGTFAAVQVFGGAYYLVTGLDNWSAIYWGLGGFVAATLVAIIGHWAGDLVLFGKIRSLSKLSELNLGQALVKSGFNLLAGGVMLGGNWGETTNTFWASVGGTATLVFLALVMGALAVRVLGRWLTRINLVGQVNLGSTEAGGLYFALLLAMSIILGVSASGDYTSLGPVLGSTAFGATLALGGTFGALKLIDALALPGKNILGRAVTAKMPGAILLASIFLVMASVVMAWLSKPLYAMIATMI